MFYNDMKIELFSEAHGGEEERNGERSEDHNPAAESQPGGAP